MARLFSFLLMLFSLQSLHGTPNHSAAMLPSTAGDPDSFIGHCVNAINGDYCEAVTDIIIKGPEPLLLQRFYNAKNYLTGEHCGGWRLFSQHFLVLGKDLNKQSTIIDNESYEKVYAFTGDRSGSILTYSGWAKRNSGWGWINRKSIIKNPLKIDLTHDGIGIVNTYMQLMSGQTDYKNNCLYAKGDTCEIISGDGMKRLYAKVKTLPILFFGEELIPSMANQVQDAEYYHLIQETLPSGQHIFFSYEASTGHLTSIEMKNSAQTKTLSWIHLDYKRQGSDYLITAFTSDERTIEYHVQQLDDKKGNVTYALTEVKGSHLIPSEYQYQLHDGCWALTKKLLPEGHFVEIDYDKQGRVHSLKSPHPTSGHPEVNCSFVYGKGCADVFDAAGTKTRYLFDDRCQLTAIEKYDDKGKLHRVDQKFWGKTEKEIGRLLAKVTLDHTNTVHSYSSYEYDEQGNLIAESLYGNLTGAQASLQVDTAGLLVDAKDKKCLRTTYVYSNDGLNLLIRNGDEQNHTLYTYKQGTNLCLKELLVHDKKIVKRIVREYNEDGICIKTVEDNGTNEEGSNATETYIKTIQPKASLPGIGLPEVITETVLDPVNHQEMLVKRLVNTFNPQGNLLCCETYDAKGEYAYSESKNYNCLGLPITELNRLGQQIIHTYDDCGRKMSTTIPHEEKELHYTYDFRDQLIKTVENIGNLTFVTRNTFDLLGRVTSISDHFGNITMYEYDAFGNQSKVVFPAVYDETENVVCPTFTYEHDIDGNAIRITDPKGNTVNKTYNIRGKPSRIEYSDGSFERFRYGVSGSLRHVRSRDGFSTAYQYDGQNRVISECKQIVYNSSADLISSLNHKYDAFHCIESEDWSLVTQNHYDAYGRLIKIIQCPKGKNENDSETCCTELFYDSLGRVCQKKTWFDVGPQDYTIEHITYNLSGQILEKRIEDAFNTTLLHSGFQYNFRGQCIEEYTYKDNIKVITKKTSYNPLGEPCICSDGLGNETRIDVDYAYCNSLGQQVVKKTVTNPIGVQTEIEYDAVGKIVSVRKKDPMGILLCSNRILYDACGNQCEELHDLICDGQVKGSKRIRSLYGPMGQLDAQIESDERKTTYTYNDKKQLTSKTIPGYSLPLSYTYNASGNLETIEWKGKNHEQIHNIYRYDAFGNLKRASSMVHNRFVERTYNALKQITQETVYDGYGQYSLKYTYDRRGRVTSIVLPDGSTIKYSYQAFFGHKVQRLSSQGEVLYAHTYESYDSNGRVTAETLPGHAGTQKHSYDINGQEIGLETSHFTQNSSYDSLGRQTKLSRKGACQPTEACFTYNDRSQLISETGLKTQTYLHDSLDNILQINDEKLTYNAIGQLLAFSNIQYTYDPQGNLLHKILDKEKVTFESNALSQITQIQKSDKTAVHFLHDPLGRRLVKKHTSSLYVKPLSIQRLFYFGDLEIGSLDEKGNIQELRLPGLSGGQLSFNSISIEISGKPYTPLHDINENVVALVDHLSGNIVESYAYSAFGQETIFDAQGNQLQESSVHNPWRYAEKRIDKETGLLFFGARYYDPQIGRWISPDPLGTLDGPNPYAYLHNNPLNYVDRFGLLSESKHGYSYTYYDDRREEERIRYCAGSPEDEYQLCHCHPVKQANLSSQHSNYIRLPKVVYDDTFDERYTNYAFEINFGIISQHNQYYEPSKIYDLEGLPELSDMRIMYINGMDNSFSEARKNADDLSKLSGGYNIHAVYNATHGKVIDPYECSQGRNHIATNPVRLLHQAWNDFFNTSSSNARLMMICHSQGAIHVMNALLDYSPALRNRILTVAIAPGGYIYKETCARVVHYRAEWWRDMVPLLDYAGAIREKDTITTLKSHPNAPIHDHTFISPTYERNLRQHIANYIHSGGNKI